MDAHDKLGIVCIVFTALISSFLFLFKIGVAYGFWLMAIVLFIIAAPLLWIAGLNTMEYALKPFVEKGLKGFLGWVVMLVLAGVIYGVFFVGLYFLFKNLQLF